MSKCLDEANSAPKRILFIKPSIVARAVFRKKNNWEGGGGGANMDRVAKGQREGEGMGGGCARS